MKLDICRHLCLNYREIENFISPEPPEEEDSSENFELDMAISLLGEVTQGGYNRLRDKLVKNKLTDVKKFPSFYTLTKSRPRIESLKIIPLPTDFDEIDNTDEGEIDENFASVSLDDLIDAIESSDENLPSSKIYGTYTDFVNMMLEKHRDKAINIVGNAAVLDSYDGAVHSNSDKARCNVVSFSSQLFSNSTVAGGASTASSKNILTWQQFVGEEKFGNLLPLLIPVFQKKHELRSAGPHQGINLKILELHDGKMAYLLTQHSLYSRKHNPFLLCCCDRGQGARSKNHTCVQLSHSDQVKYYERSLTRWDRKRSLAHEMCYYPQAHDIPAPFHAWSVTRGSV